MRQDRDITGSGLAVIDIVAGLAAAVLAAFSAPVTLWICMVVFCLLWIPGVLALSDGASRAFLAGTLRKSTYTQIYTTLTGRTVGRLWGRFCDPAEDRAGVPTLFPAALTWRLYDAAPLIAAAYPIMLPVVQWLVTGAAVRVGGIELLPDAPFLWVRASVSGALVILILGIVVRRKASTRQHNTSRLVTDGPFVSVAAMIVAISAAAPSAAIIVFVSAGTFLQVQSQQQQQFLH